MAGPVAGVDLGGTKIQTIVVRGRKVIGAARVPTPQTGANDIIAAIADTVRHAAGLAGLKASDLSAVGMGSPGDVDPATGIVASSPNLPGFHEGPVKMGPLLARRLRVPVTVDNDVRVAMLGEHKRGAARGYANVLAVFVGTGVGGGLVLGGRVQHGNGAAGEIGHSTVKDGGRLCSCGRKGHLESYAGRARIEATARKMHKDGDKTDLFKIMKKRGRDRLTSGTIARALEAKDKVATKLIDEAVWALGIALANAHQTLDLEAIVVGGGLGDRLGEAFIDRIADAMRPRLKDPDGAPLMRTTELQDLSGAVGAAVLVGG
jgi:glucokinase